MADVEPEPDAAGAVRGFYAAYWMRVRTNLWGEVDEAVVPVLLGRFKHEVTVCPDGLVVVMYRASADSFAWVQSSEGALSVVSGLVGTDEARAALGLDGFRPGEPTELDFDLDVATRREDESRLPFDRLQMRFVSFERDYGFWTPTNAERLAARNLDGPLE